MNQLVTKAYAKINLGLDVLGKLPNGYHLVKMIMQTVDIWDELTIEAIPEGILITTDSGELPVNEDNLIYKAARLMMDNYAVNSGVHIHLSKHIPIAAGMAGGSTDAAATMTGMNTLFHLQVSQAELMDKAVSIGADVPYCILGGTALAEGIGEKLTTLPPAPSCYLVVAKPDINVSTKYVYQHLDACETLTHPDIDGMVDAIWANSLSGITGRMGNVLETVTIPAHPIIATLKEKMMQYGAVNALMSGSGPTVFGIFTDESLAKEAFAALQKDNLAKQIFVTTFVSERG